MRGHYFKKFNTRKMVLLTCVVTAMLHLSLWVFILNTLPYMLMCAVTRLALILVHSRWEMEKIEVLFFSIFWPITAIFGYLIYLHQERIYKEQIVEEILNG